MNNHETGSNNQNDPSKDEVEMSKLTTIDIDCASCGHPMTITAPSKLLNRGGHYCASCQMKKNGTLAQTTKQVIELRLQQEEDEAKRKGN